MSHRKWESVRKKPQSLGGFTISWLAFGFPRYQWCFVSFCLFHVIDWEGIWFRRRTTGKEEWWAAVVKDPGYQHHWDFNILAARAWACLLSASQCLWRRLTRVCEWWAVGWGVSGLLRPRDHSWTEPVLNPQTIIVSGWPSWEILGVGG